RQEMIDLFGLEKVNKAPASFDPKKLFAFQDRDMQKLPAGEKTRLVLPFLQRAGLGPSPAPQSDVAKGEEIVRAAGDRIKVAGDILDYVDFFLPDDRLPYDDAAFEKRLRKPAEAAGLLRKFRGELAAVEPFDAAGLERRLQGFIAAEGVTIGQIIH